MHLELTRDVAASAERVWAVLTDLDTAADTLSGVDSVSRIGGPAYGPGTTWRETRTMLGRSESQEMVVMEAHPPTRTVIEAVVGDLRYLTTFTVLQTGPQSSELAMRFEADQSAGGGAVRRLAGAVMGHVGLAVTRKVMRQDLADIAAAAEAGTRP